MVMKTSQVLRDLSQKYPVGPRRLLTSVRYIRRRVWIGDAGCDRTIHFLNPDTIGSLGITAENIQFCGYEPAEIFEMLTQNGSSPDLDIGLLTSMLKNHLALKQGPARARARVIMGRLGDGFNAYRKKDKPGIWTVTSHKADYGSLWRDFPVWGASAGEVEAIARTIGPMTGLDPAWPIRVNFNRLGSREEAAKAAMSHATMKQRSLVRELEAAEKKLEDLKKKLENENNQLIPIIGGLMLINGSPEEGEEESQ